MRTSIFGWAFLATLMTSAAFAADPMAVAPVASTFNWSGGYLGVQGGYGWGDSDHLLGGTNETAHNNADGGVFGGYAGYNYQFSNNMVLGVEGDIAWSGQNGGPDIIVSPAGVPNPPNAVSTDVEWTGALRGRLGECPVLQGGDMRRVHDPHAVGGQMRLGAGQTPAEREGAATGHSHHQAWRKAERRTARVEFLHQSPRVPPLLSYRS